MYGINANKAVELGFADTILTREGDSEESVLANAVLFSPKEVSNVIFNKLTKVCTAADNVKPQQVENKAKDTLQTEPPKDKGADSGTDATNNSEDGEQETSATDSDSHIPQGRSVDDLMERLPGCVPVQVMLPTRGTIEEPDASKLVRWVIELTSIRAATAAKSDHSMTQSCMSLLVGS